MTTILTRVNQLAGTNNVLDVSKIRPDGTGIRVITAPTTRSAKKMIPDLPIVSDNYNAYRAAIRLLGPEYQPYANEYLRLYGEGEIPTTLTQVRPASPLRIQPTLVDILQTATYSGKVLDVSNLKADGTGSRVIRPPSTRRWYQISL